MLATLLLTALADTAKRAFRRRNSAQGDAERGVRGILRWNAQAYAHQHIAFASQPISRRDRCRSLPPPTYLSPLLGEFDAMTAQEVQQSRTSRAHPARAHGARLWPRGNIPIARAVPVLPIGRQHGPVFRRAVNRRGKASEHNELVLSGLSARNNLRSPLVGEHAIAFSMRYRFAA